MTELSELAERLTYIAESIDENSYMHPLGAHEDCLLAAAVVADYVEAMTCRSSVMAEMAKLRAGFAWTAKKEEIMRAEYWTELEARLQRIKKELQEKYDE